MSHVWVRPHIFPTTDLVLGPHFSCHSHHSTFPLMSSSPWPSFFHCQHPCATSHITLGILPTASLDLHPSFSYHTHYFALPFMLPCPWSSLPFFSCAQITLLINWSTDALYVVTHTYIDLLSLFRKCSHHSNLLLLSLHTTEHHDCANQFQTSDISIPRR